MSSQLSASLFRLKLLDAFRGEDESKVKALFTELSNVESTVDTAELIKLKETIIHYAVQVAPLSLIQALVNNPIYGIDINAQDADGNTPLHLAVISSRGNVVKFLMALPSINDTVVNADGKQAVELAKDTNIAQLMQYERARFVENAATQLRKYFSNRDFDNLEDLLVNNPRAAELLDINGADPETGNTVLHEFIRKEDLQMCEWILKHGGDPFKRDKKGKLPIGLVNNRSDPIRKLLNSVSKDQSMLDPANSSGPNGLGAPTYKGYLKKWTNFASGYKLRYFILDQFGVLSYYTNQSDTMNACRGSLNLGYAFLHLDSSEKLKFEIIGKNGIKWHLKANHPTETNRWVWTLQNAINAAKDRIKRNRQPVKSLEAQSAKEDEEKEKKSRLLTVPGRRRLHKKKTASQVLVSSFAHSDAEDNHSVISAETGLGPNTTGNLTKINKNGDNSASTCFSLELHTAGEDFDFDLDDSLASDADSTGEHKSDDISQESIQALSRLILIEIDSLKDLFKVLESSQLDEKAREETQRIGAETFNNVKSMIDRYHVLSHARDAHLLKQIERQKKVNKLWETSIRQLEDEMQKQQMTLAQYDEKQVKLRKLLESKGISSALYLDGKVMYKGADAKSTDADNTETVENSSIIEQIFNGSDDEFFDADDFDDTTEEAVEAPADAPTNGHSVDTKKDPMDIEMMTDKQELLKKILLDEQSFLGYENPPRIKLAMDSDDRPKVGLWGILKSMIGKDMTKMTLPVFFNECTSLLQRLTEDIEYNDLLSKAASINDSTLRMVNVVAFAASEYASTIDRIAKPFNPLLGETFEYCRKDQSFRLICEQVSHHPPISACCAQSLKWDYYGENAVDSQFRGRSFDFKHLGKMFCVIRPDAGVITQDGTQVEEELYSWKKVNTSVVGIIIGSPTVDNFGTMEVTNHTTGDTARVEMKQRGWKASSAYQLSGVVTDAKGNNRWAVGGHWNSRIFAKKISGSGSLDKKRHESLIETLESSSSDPYSGSKFLVWQAAPRPKVPFNLTLFAITLNEINDNLRPWLPPTDTRLRPDQRAMEDGRYDEASKEKHRVEEKQRAARKRREANREVYKPNWFVKLKHPVTGDAYWKFKGDYWRKRSRKELAGTGDIF